MQDRELVWRGSFAAVRGRERETNGVSRRIAPTEVTAGVTDQRTIMQNRVSLSVVCVT